MDVFREPPCAKGMTQGTGSWKVRTVFRRSDNGRPSETQPKFGSRFYEGLCLGRNYPGIAAFWNERRNRVVMQLTRQGRVDAQGHEEKGFPQDLSQRAGDACQMWASFLKPSGETNRESPSSPDIQDAYWIHRNPPPDSVGSRRQRARLITQSPRFSSLK